MSLIVKKRISVQVEELPLITVEASPSSSSKDDPTPKIMKNQNVSQMRSFDSRP